MSKTKINIKELKKAILADTDLSKWLENNDIVNENEFENLNSYELFKCAMQIGIDIENYTETAIMNKKLCVINKRLGTLEKKFAEQKTYIGKAIETSRKRIN